MKLKELLLLSELKNSKLLTEKIGLNNDVDSVMILEAIDLENWSKKNQLILTSFYAIKDLSDNELQIFFKKMRNIGISGLILKTGRAINKIPQWFIDLCISYKIPLIKITQDISYEKILLLIYEPLLNYQSHVLRSYYDIRQRFTKLERNHPRVEVIMHEFYTITNFSYRLQIINEKKEISEGKILDDYIVFSRDPLKYSEFTKNQYIFLTLYSHIHPLKKFALEVLVINNNSTEFKLVIFLNDNIVKETDLVIIEYVIDMLQKFLNTEKLLKKERYTRLNNLADAILQNTPTKLEELNSLLHEANMQKFASYQAIVFPTKSLEISKSIIISHLRSLREQSIFFDHLNYSAILFNFDESDGIISKKQVYTLLKNILLENKNLILAISDLKTKTNLKEILIECLDIIKFNSNMHIEQIVTLEDLGPFQYLINEDSIENLNQLIPYSLKNLSINNKDLFETLYYFFKNNRNYKKTAESMFLHSKTVRYRLSKLEKILDLNLENSVQMLNYEIAVYILIMRMKSD